MSDIELYGDAKWESPWVFHAMVALDELGLEYTLHPLVFPIEGDVKAKLAEHAHLPKTPCLVHGKFWLTESSAISEYLAEVFAPPAYPRIMPSSVEERARARQVMSWLRTSLMGLREDRPTSSVFMHPVHTPLTARGKEHADEVIGVAMKLLAHGRNTLFDAWCVADADLALMLMRLVANNDPAPDRIVEYTTAQWQRQSVRKYLAHIPTTP